MIRLKHTALVIGYGLFLLLIYAEIDVRGLDPHDQIGFMLIPMWLIVLALNIKQIVRGEL